ncbi:MAG: hypothetical protein HY727_03785 [Candidatus Rokubacteria bacterium]|nr:hypothetical protein [Candidatus Rokubacteria bacterium]
MALGRRGEDRTAAELRRLLEIPRPLLPIATIPIGAPRRRPEGRWRAPLDELHSWNTFDRAKFRSGREIRFYVEELRAHAMYWTSERMEDCPDYATVAAKRRRLEPKRGLTRNASGGRARGRSGS